jgi:hypothetical protein
MEIAKWDLMLLKWKKHRNISPSVRPREIKCHGMRRRKKKEARRLVGASD